MFPDIHKWPNVDIVYIMPLNLKFRMPNFKLKCKFKHMNWKMKDQDNEYENCDPKS